MNVSTLDKVLDSLFLLLPARQRVWIELALTLDLVILVPYLFE